MGFKAYFLEFWTWVELGIILCSLVGVAFYILRFKLTLDVRIRNIRGTRSRTQAWTFADCG